MINDIYPNGESLPSAVRKTVRKMRLNDPGLCGIVTEDELEAVITKIIEPTIPNLSADEIGKRLRNFMERLKERPECSMVQPFKIDY